MPLSPTIVWFRLDLRLQDNPALHAAVERGGPVIPVYVRDDGGEGRWVSGAASRWWLHRSLDSLDRSLREYGLRLCFARGESAEELLRLVNATGAGAVYWNRRYEPDGRTTDAQVESVLRVAGVEMRSFNGALLFEPGTVTNKQGEPYQVFTSFWRRSLTLPVAEPVTIDLREIGRPKVWPESLTLADLELTPTSLWDTGLAEAWIPGEATATQRLRSFMATEIVDYATSRDCPAKSGTSRLSPHLHFGEISPRQIWAAARAASAASGVFPLDRGTQVFLREVGWREFAHHLLFHFPHTPETPLKKAFAAFVWADDPDGSKLEAWQRGRTGYPIVDAGMRELWTTGWMHNRLRMVVASFFVKHLRLSWRQGAAWFWETLVDADLANNTLGWQWSAGCGADAAPYFRIFAPVLQGEKFDRDGDYVRQWVPELARLPTKWIHRPWEAPKEVLIQSGVTLGDSYPYPIVEHARARVEALAAWKRLRKRP